MDAGNTHISTYIPGNNRKVGNQMVNEVAKSSIRSATEITTSIKAVRSEISERTEDGFSSYGTP